MNEELDLDGYSRPLYETASVYEMDEPSAYSGGTTADADCENLYAPLT